MAHSESDEKLNEARLRLVDAAAFLKPIDNPVELLLRVQRVAHELHNIEESLLLFIHCAQLEGSDIEDQIQRIEKDLKNGLVPESSSVDDVIARQRQAWQLS